MRAAIYARYSSDNQREESITAQLRICHDHCAKKGYTVVKEYTDEAQTGKNDRRPGFQRMLREAQQRLYDVVVVHKVNRFARNRLSAAISKAKLNAAGVRLEYVELQVEGKHGVILESVLEGMAEYYSLDLSDEVKKGMAENAYMAKHNGGKPALGFDVVDGEYVINEKEAEVVRLIFKMRADGAGYGDILAALNMWGHKTKSGKPFGKNSLADLLRNKKYIGTYVFGRVATQKDGTRNNHKVDENAIEKPGALPAIIDAETWAKVQGQIERSKHAPGVHKAKEVYNLSGLIKCACGSVMVGSRIKSRGNVYVYYRCDSQQRKKGCNVSRIKREDVEGFVFDKIHSDILAPERLPELTAEIDAARQELDGARAEEIRKLEARRADLSRQMNNLLDFIADGKKDDRLKARYDETNTKLAQVEYELEEIQAAAGRQRMTKKQFQLVLEDLAKIEKGTDKARTLYELFVNEIVVSQDELTVALRFAFDWWRRGESNPCPKASLHRLLRAQSML